MNQNCNHSAFIALVVYIIKMSYKDHEYSGEIASNFSWPKTLSKQKIGQNLSSDKRLAKNSWCAKDWENLSSDKD